MLGPGGHFLKLTAVFCLLSLFTTGCWDNREPEWLASSLLLAFDLDEEKGEKMYKALVVLANPLFQSGGESGSTGGGGGEKMPFWVHSARGRTPFEAILNLSQGTTRQIRFFHTQALLFSEKLAREGIWPVLELFQRHRELRPTVQTAVVDGDLEELLRTEFPLEFLPSTAVDRLLRITGIERSIIPDSQLLKKLIEFTRPGEEMILARIKALPQKVGGEPQGEDQQGQQGKGQQGKEQRGGNQQVRRNQQGQTPPGPPAEAIGAAVFRGDKMVGWMDGHETRGQNWVRNTLQRGVIVIELPGKNGLAAIEIIKIWSKIKPRINGGEVTITVDITAEGRLQDFVVSPAEAPRLDKSLDQDLENRYAEAIRRECERSLTRAKELKADIFGFGNAIYCKYPRLWEKELAGRWEEAFSRLSVEFLVEAPIKRSGLIHTSPSKR
jgi:spore germination protein KC